MTHLKVIDFNSQWTPVQW